MHKIDLSSISPQDISVYKKEWDGLGESKGTLLSLIFLFSLFKIKAHTTGEIISRNGALQVRSGLRSQEVNAPVLIPTKYDLPQVGSLDDYQLGAFTNQLVADRTIASSEEDANNIFFRLPFYYNRDGKSWDLVKSIAEYWVQTKLNSRVQYAYLAAGLWKQGDAFFDPLSIDESTLDANITSESSNILTTESSDPIIAE